MTAEALPLVTFALLTFNQEAFVEEAVTAAFAQDYENLEIIISDDESQDGTMDILRRLTGQYQGKHRVTLRRTERNRGIFNHVLEVAKIAQGDLIVLAAGDDVSFPQRTRHLVDAWRSTGVAAFSSRFDVIDDTGETIIRSLKSPGGGEVRNWLADGSLPFVFGAASCYTKKLFAKLKFSAAPIFNEDAVMSALAWASGLGSFFVEESLISYRTHSSSLSADFSVSETPQAIEAFEHKVARSGASSVAMCEYLQGLEPIYPALSQLGAGLSNTMRMARLCRDWIDANPVYRLALLFRCRSLRELRFLLPRLLGLRVFVRVKSRLRR